jgi:hypothetical protein
MSIKITPVSMTPTFGLTLRRAILRSWPTVAAGAMASTNSSYKLRFVSPRRPKSACLPDEHLLRCQPVSPGNLGSDRALDPRPLDNSPLVVSGNSRGRRRVTRSFRYRCIRTCRRRPSRYQPSSSRREGTTYWRPTGS